MSLEDATLGVCGSGETQQAEAHAWGAAWTDSGPVFTREDGSGLHPSSVTDLFQAVSANAGRPPIRLHDLRHTAASLALQPGVPARLLGYPDRPGQCPDGRHLWDAIVATAPAVIPDRQDDDADEARLRFRLALTCVRCGRIERLEGVTEEEGHYGPRRAIRSRCGPAVRSRSRSAATGVAAT